MPLYEVVAQQVYFNQVIINVWNYVSEGTPAATSGSFLLLRGMGFIPDNAVYPTGTVFDAVRALQPNTLAYSQVLSRDVYSTTDFWENPYVVRPAGLLSAEGLSPAIAYGLRTNRVRADIRRGQKRIAGVTESASGAGGVLTPGTQAAVATIAARMSAPIVVDDSGNTVTFIPCVVKKEKYLVPDSNPPRFAYRYYEDEEEQLDNVATGVIWQGYTQTRTQTSRQYGRGE